MERSSEDVDEEKASEIRDPLLVQTSSKGGLTTLPFILGNEIFERAANCGLEPNMIVYLMGGYGLEMATGANIIFFWNAVTNFTPIIGAFLADTVAGRFRMIGFGSIFSLMGMTLLWSTTIIPGARPSCDNNTSTNTCTSSTPFQLILLCFSLGLMSIGSGGIRSSTIAFGADQLVSIEEEGSKPNKGGVLESFFNWYYFSTSFAFLFAVTCVVYIQDHMGWKVGFAVPLFLMFLSAISFFLASSLYVKCKPRSSLLTGFAQVVVASWRNRHYESPSHESTEILYHVKGSTLAKPTTKLRFLNKACIVKDPIQELTPEGAAMNPWHLCTIDQVEAFKSVVKVLPLWTTGILIGVNQNQISFRVVQANSMDRHILSSSFEIPAGSFGTFALVTVLLWLVLYDRVIIPLASKAKGEPTYLDPKNRMGFGMLLCILGMVVSAVVESVRRDRATGGGKLPDYPSSKISALWLVPQTCLIGLGETLCAIAQIEFFYSEFPRTMSSISSNLWGLGIGVASLVASLIMSLIDHITKQGGQQSWVSGDVNKGHYDYYYWVLVALNLLNYMYFLLCSRAYWQDKKILSDAKEITDI